MITKSIPKTYPSKYPVIMDIAPADKKTIVSIHNVIKSFNAVIGVAFFGIALHSFMYIGAPTKKIIKF